MHVDVERLLASVVAAAASGGATARVRVSYAVSARPHSDILNSDSLPPRMTSAWCVNMEDGRALLLGRLVLDDPGDIGAPLAAAI